MLTKIGHFEILSELAKSPFGAVYKANDPGGQTIALKAIQLKAFGEESTELEKALLDEAESTKNLTNSNIASVFGAGEIEGQFCAAMEYIQGNSIATMLERKEGFSIWDLLDISRQVCSGLDYAHSQNAFHYSLEPSKIMCGWDGTVKILSFGISSVGKFFQRGAGPVPSFVYYMSPEQLNGEAVDARSNLFSLGAMFYEMVTDHRAFDGPDLDSLRHAIAEAAPLPPLQLNAKVHPLLSQLILKAISKDPAQRYQSGRELLDDLEKCKESRPQAKPAPAVPKAPVAPAASAQTKFAAPAPSPRPAAEKPPVAVQPEVKKPPAAPAATKAKAAAASVGAVASAAPKSALLAKFDVTAADAPSASMSAATVEPEVETFSPESAPSPRITVDPMMAGGGPATTTRASFSDISELPPLKEVYIAPVPPPAPEPDSEPAAPPAPTVFTGKHEVESKPKIQPREAAQKAIKEIKSVPPQLMLYSIAGALVIIVIIAIMVMFRIHSTSSDDDFSASTSQPAAQPAVQPAQPVQAAPAPAPVPAPPPAVAEQPAAQAPAPEVAAPTRNLHASSAHLRHKKSSKAAAPVLIPGQMVVESNPSGAQVRIDGQSDPTWVTPLQISSLEPGQHSLVVTKAGYSTDSRTITVASASKSDIVVHLSQLMAMLSVTSSPAGASIFVDGRDTGKLTPAQVSVDKGQHIVLVRKMGYIDETTSAQFVPGQTVAISPALRNLGNVDSIHTVGKMKRLFGRDRNPAGEATISIRTQPKGAEVAINQHMIGKDTPVQVTLDPGNYVVDITMSGYAPIHRVVTADKDGKVVIDETLTPQ